MNLAKPTLVKSRPAFEQTQPGDIDDGQLADKQNQSTLLSVRKTKSDPQTFSQQNVNLASQQQDGQPHVQNSLKMQQAKEFDDSNTIIKHQNNQKLSLQKGVYKTNANYSVTISQKCSLNSKNSNKKCSNKNRKRKTRAGGQISQQCSKQNDDNQHTQSNVVNSSNSGKRQQLQLNLDENNDQNPFEQTGTRRKPRRKSIRKKPLEQEQRTSKNYQNDQEENQYKKYVIPNQVRDQQSNYHHSNSNLQPNMNQVQPNSRAKIESPQELGRQDRSELPPAETAKTEKIVHENSNKKKPVAGPDDDGDNKHDFVMGGLLRQLRGEDSPPKQMFANNPSHNNFRQQQEGYFQPIDPTDYDLSTNKARSQIILTNPSNQSDTHSIFGPQHSQMELRPQNERYHSFMGRAAAPQPIHAQPAYPEHQSVYSDYNTNNQDYTFGGGGDPYLSRQQQQNPDMNQVNYQISQGGQTQCRNDWGQYQQAPLSQIVGPQEYQQMLSTYRQLTDETYMKQQWQAEQMYNSNIMKQQNSQVYQVTQNLGALEISKNMSAVTNLNTQFKSDSQNKYVLFDKKKRNKNQYELFVEKQLGNIHYTIEEPSAFRLNNHYYMMFSNLDENFIEQNFQSQANQVSKQVNQQPKTSKSRQSPDSNYETVNNRLLQMTSNIQSNFENINQYKKARQQVLEQIVNGSAGRNFIERNVRPAPTTYPYDASQNPNLPSQMIPDNDSDEQRNEIEIGTGSEYVLRQNQVIISPENVRYKIIKYIGQGTFGQVVRCVNLETNTEHAIKIIKNKQEYTIQGLVEIKILHKLINDPNVSEFEKQHLINMQDYFVFRDYLCIVFEMMGGSLYDLVSSTDRGLPLEHVREYTRQILEALATIKNRNVIHCDLKPENILLSKDGQKVKLIDFGSAAFNGHQVYTYIQSRYYRAPEVLLGSYQPPQFPQNSNIQQQPRPAYNQSIDMWSLGCTIIELFIKTPIFPGKYDYDQIYKILEFCGLPPFEMVAHSLNRDRFFIWDPTSGRYTPKTYAQFMMTNGQPHMRYEVPYKYHPFNNFGQLLEQWYIQKLRVQNATFLQSQGMQIDNINQVPFEYTVNERMQIFQFIDFVQQILQVDPQRRLTPLQALSHPFITGQGDVGLPFMARRDCELQQYRNNQIEYYLQAASVFKQQTPFSRQYKINNNLQINQTDYNNQLNNNQAANQQIQRQCSISQFISQAKQVNGRESFRPPLSSFQESYFYGHSYNTLQEFYQESRIQFQIHQQSLIDEIELQKQLLNSHQFCDAKILADVEVDEDYLKKYHKNKQVLSLKIKREQTMLELQKDQSIIHPKSILLKDDTTKRKIIKDILQKEIADKSLDHKCQNFKSQEDIIESDQRDHIYQNSLEFQLQHFEEQLVSSSKHKSETIGRCPSLEKDHQLAWTHNAEFLQDSISDNILNIPNKDTKCKRSHTTTKNSKMGVERGMSNDVQYARNLKNFYGISNDDIEQIQISKQSANLKKDVLRFRGRGRSGSTETLPVIQPTAEKGDIQNTIRKTPKTISNKDESLSETKQEDVNLINQNIEIEQSQLEGGQKQIQTFEDQNLENEYDTEQDTEFDTDNNELFGQGLSSNNNSFENQDRMVGGHSSHGGIKFLQKYRTKKQKHSQKKQSSTKSSLKTTPKNQ